MIAATNKARLMKATLRFPSSHDISPSEHLCDAKFYAQSVFPSVFPSLPTHTHSQRKLDDDGRVEGVKLRGEPSSRKCDTPEEREDREMYMRERTIRKDETHHAGRTLRRAKLLHGSEADSVCSF